MVCSVVDMKITKIEKETKGRHPSLAPVEALVLETAGDEMPDMRIGVNREYINAKAIFSEKNPAKKKDRKKVTQSGPVVSGPLYSNRPDGREWTSVDDQLLKKLLKANTPVQMIGLKLGLKLGRSLGSVR
jgi:hypothetical protein